MRRLNRIIITLCLPVLLGTPAWAWHSGPYAGISLGGNALMTSTCNDNLGEFDLRFNPGLSGSVMAGWDLEPGSSDGEGHFELEYSHRINQLNKARFSEGAVPAGGTLSADSLLFNFYGVLHSEYRRWSPYAGAGFGAVRIDTTNLTVTSVPLSSDSALAFAYQLGLGIDYALTERFNLDLGYRLFGSSRPGFHEINGPNFRMDYLDQSIVLGIKIGL